MVGMGVGPLQWVAGAGKRMMRQMRRIINLS
jgi:hypothetical protein